MTGRVVVVGSGIIGLVVAVRLAEAGHDVEVIAAEAWEQTVSRVAGGLWLPYLVGGAHVHRWAAAGYRVLAADAAAGVPGARLAPYRELAAAGDSPLARPDWAGLVDGFRTLVPDELEPPWRWGHTATVPIVDTGRYLPWLARRLEDAGGRIEIRRLTDLAEAGPAEVVVHCSGLGAAELAGDTSIRPVRGQVVVVENPGMDGAAAADDGSYAIAHTDTVVLGGTSDMGATDLTPDASVTAAILERAGRLLPGGARPSVVAVRVGLRPWRPAVRLEEADPPPGVGRLVHCYGHGGAGVTLAWGCAADVLVTVGGSVPAA